VTGRARIVYRPAHWRVAGVFTVDADEPSSTPLASPVEEAAMDGYRIGVMSATPRPVIGQRQRAGLSCVRCRVETGSSVAG
jgi:hypothetical protein